MRGEIVAIDERELTIHETDGRQIVLAIGPYTTYAYVVPSNVVTIHAGTFLGAAVKAPMTHLTAVEAALIPRSL